MFSRNYGVEGVTPQGSCFFQSGATADTIPLGELFYLMGKLNDDLEPTVATSSPTN